MRGLRWRTLVVATAVIALLVPALGAEADRFSRGKVEVCHIPPGNPGEAHTITVGAKALRAHLAHGDILGPCARERPDGQADDGKRRPVARAGADSCVVFGSRVELDGTGSFDPDGEDDALVFDWDVVARPPSSTLDDRDLSPDDDDDDPIFTPDQFGVFGFALEVSDSDGFFDTDTVEVEVHMTVTVDRIHYDVAEGETTPAVITLNQKAPRDLAVAIEVLETDEVVAVLDEDDQQGEAIDELVIEQGDSTAIFYLLGLEDDDSRNEYTTVTVSVGSRECGDSETARVDVDDNDGHSLSPWYRVQMFYEQFLVFTVLTAQPATR